MATTNKSHKSTFHIKYIKHIKINQNSKIAINYLNTHTTPKGHIIHFNHIYTNKNTQTLTKNN